MPLPRGRPGYRRRHHRHRHAHPHPNLNSAARSPSQQPGRQAPGHDPHRGSDQLAAAIVRVAGFEHLHGATAPHRQPRGLGSVRTLVLVNGRRRCRAIPARRSGLNFIRLAVDRIDVLTARFVRVRATPSRASSLHHGHGLRGIRLDARQLLRPRQQHNPGLSAGERGPDYAVPPSRADAPRSTPAS